MNYGKHCLMWSVGYQLALSQGLQAWIANAPRLDLISANKEGICSFSGTTGHQEFSLHDADIIIGYLAIFLLGLDSGTVVFPRLLGESRLTDTPSVKQVATQLIYRAAMLWLALQAWISITGSHEDFYVSRQMVRQKIERSTRFHRFRLGQSALHSMGHRIQSNTSWIAGTG